MRQHEPRLEWTPDAIGRLTRLWAEGRSTAQIGRQLGVSKNAVIGKAHRLKLAGRPSPVVRDGVARPKAAARDRSIPKLGELQRPTLPAAQVGASTVAVIPRADPVPVAARRPITPERLDLRARPAQPCCWPIGEPGRPGFRFCDAPSLAAKPYCAEHAARAYVRHRSNEIGMKEEARI